MATCVPPPVVHFPHYSSPGWACISFDIDRNYTQSFEKCCSVAGVYQKVDGATALGDDENQISCGLTCVYEGRNNNETYNDFQSCLGKLHGYSCEIGWSNSDGSDVTPPPSTTSMALPTSTLTTTTKSGATTTWSKDGKLLPYFIVGLAALAIVGGF